MINPPSTNFAEQWQQLYAQLSKSISYKAFDFNGIKRSLIEYLQTYHPEHFNNLIETDELLPLIEMFAYVGELYAYRADVNTQEHILSTTTRKSSAIQIANMVGYKPSRRVPATGLVKITSVSTTESVVDSTQVDLQRKVIRWNDSTNPNWRTQFSTVLNRILNNTIGVTADSDKTQINDVLVERYTTSTRPISNGVFKYSAVVNGSSIPMEVVGVSLTNGTIVEQPPTGDRTLDILFADDGRGNSSPTTGFMMLTKQGTLASQPLLFNGKTVNLNQQVNVPGINDTDVWLASLTDAGDFVKHWTIVDNIAYNSSESRSVFQTSTLENDQINLSFGDGNYSTIPNGNFRVWYRTSAELDTSLQVGAISDQKMSLEYFDVYGNIQTLSLTFSLLSPITTSSSSESLEDLKKAIPGVFYTQDRMVNAQDHQTYLMQDPGVLKVKAVNRTFAGQSKYSGWHDGSEVYENVKIFSNDGVIYFEPSTRIIEVSNANSTVSSMGFVVDGLSAVLNYPDLWLAIVSKTSTPTFIRTNFTNGEMNAIATALDLLTMGNTIDLSYNSATSAWEVRKNAISNVDIQIKLQTTAKGWSIFVNTNRTVLHSSSTKFWRYSTTKTVDYDTINPTRDLITILEANTGPTGSMLGQTVKYGVAGNVELKSTLPNQATLDLSKVELVGKDTSGGNFPDDIASSALINASNWVYFYRASLTDEFQYVPVVPPRLVPEGYSSISPLFTRRNGREGLNFLWQHFTDQFELINPARTNITDLYVITNAYYTEVMRWLQSTSISKPVFPTAAQLSVEFGKYLAKSMMSDELIIRPGKFKILFGSKADPTLRAKIQLVLAGNASVAKDAIKQEVVKLIRQFFDIANVEFGDTFFFSKLSSYIQTNTAYNIGSVVLVPLYPAYQFGDLYQLTSAPDEIFCADVTVADIEIVGQITAAGLRV